MSITPRSPDPTARGKVRTWVTSQWKLRPSRVNSQRKSTIHSLTGVYGPDGLGGTANTRPFLYENNAVSYNQTYAQLGEETLALIRKKVEHPLVCTHPETGRPILYATGNHIIGLKGMTDLESRPLLDFLNQHVTRPEFTCRFRWKKGSLAIWDNRCALHYAANDYEGFARSMLRVELEGDRPFGPAMAAAGEPARAGEAAV
jgi:hypothetical protein